MRSAFFTGFLFVIILFSCSIEDSNQDNDNGVPPETTTGSLSVRRAPKLVTKENILYRTQGLLYPKFHFSDDLSKAISWNKSGVILWDVSAQRILRSFNFKVNYAQINHDGSQILLNDYHDSNNPPVLIDSHSGKIIKTYERMVYAEFTNMEPAIKISNRRVEEKMMSQDGKLSFFRGKYNSPSGYLSSEGQSANFHVKFNREIKNVVFSTDNSLVAFAVDKKIHFYRYDGQFTEAHQFPYEGYLTSMAFSKDNKLLQLSYLDNKTHNRLEVRAVDSGEILYLKDNTQFLSPKNPPLFTKDGQFIFALEYLPEIQSTPKSYKMVKINWATQEHVFETDMFSYNQTVYLTSDDKYLVVGNTVFDANTGQKKVELEYHLNEIEQFEINNTGNIWAFNKFNQAFIFDKENQAFKFPQKGYWQTSKNDSKAYKDYIVSKFGKDRSSLYGKEIGGLIKKEVDPQKLAEAQRIIEQEFQKMEAVAEKQGGYYGTAIAMEFFGPQSAIAKIDPSVFQAAQQGIIYSTAYSPNRKYIAAISDLGRVYLLIARTKKIIMILPTLIENKDRYIHREMSQIFFSHNSKIVVYENYGGDKVIFSIPKKDTLFTINAGSWQDAILHPKKEEILLSKQGNILQTVNLLSGKKQFETILDADIKHFKYAKNGDEIMVITSKQEIKVYDAITGTLVDSGFFEKKGRDQYAAGNADREWAYYKKRETCISIFQEEHHCYDFYPLSDGDWAAISPYGYFDGTKQGLKKLYFSDGQKTKSLSEFPDSLHLKGILEMEAVDLLKMQKKDILAFF